MGQKLKDVQKGGQSVSQYTQPTTVYTWNDSKYPILQSQTIASLWGTIRGMQEGPKPRLSYISILLCGQSGSGKTTLAQTMIHRISCMGKERYIIKWFSGKDLHQLDDVINDLEQGLNYMLVFDDVSFILDFLPNKRKKELAEKLTRIRHDVKGKVITFMNIHYQKALMPMMRDSNFRILTSMSDQDSQNWKNTMGWNHRFAIDKFQKQYNYQMKQGYFFVNGVDHHTPDDKAREAFGGSYKYITDEPFRITLCSEGSGVHPLLVPKEGCELCTPHKTRKKKDISADQLLRKMLKGYKSTGKTAVRYWAYFHLGDKDALPPNARRAIKNIDEAAKAHGFDKKELISLIKATHGQKSIRKE